MLFKDTGKVGDPDGLKTYLGGVQNVMAWTTWKPFVEQAELAVLIPAIGQTLYDQLSADQLSADLTELRHKFRMALCWYAYADAMPSLITVTGDAGMSVPTTQNSTVMPKWLYLETRKRHAERADMNIELALAWLEENAVKFPEWKASAFYTVQRGQLIPTASEASRFFPALRGSRRLFLSMRDYFNNAAIDHIKPILGRSFYKSLLEKQAADDLTEQEEEVLKLAKRAVVQLGFAEFVPYMNLDVDFRLVYDIDGGAVAGAPPNAERLSIIRNSALDAGTGKLGELKNYLNKTASATVLTDYFNSDRYVAPQISGQVRRRANDPSKPFFVLR